VVRAHVSAADAKRGQQSQALGLSRGGFSTKIRFKTDFDSHPLDFHLTGGEVSEMTQFKTSLGLGSNINPRMVITEKGYDSAANRAAARASAITAVIPRKTNAKARGRFFPTNFYKLRARIEQTIGNDYLRYAMRGAQTRW
jgi:hypothetical protein